MTAEAGPGDGSIEDEEGEEEEGEEEEEEEEEARHVNGTTFSTWSYKVGFQPNLDRLPL